MHRRSLSSCCRGLPCRRVQNLKRFTPHSPKASRSDAASNRYEEDDDEEDEEEEEEDEEEDELDGEEDEEEGML